MNLLSLNDNSLRPQKIVPFCYFGMTNKNSPILKNGMFLFHTLPTFSTFSPYLLFYLLFLLSYFTNFSLKPVPSTNGTIFCVRREYYYYVIFPSMLHLLCRIVKLLCINLVTCIPSIVILLCLTLLSLCFCSFLHCHWMILLIAIA